MKTIKDAVIELEGKWPAETEGDTLVFGNVAECYWAQYHVELDLSCETEICTRDEFESEAKHLGYINGYRWGVEYPTNGKRPDLPDDVDVEIKSPLFDGYSLNGDFRRMWKWNAISAFKITDQRHKPADTSYLKKVSEAERFGIMPPMNINERCDLNNWHERGELPPVGEKIEYTTTEYQEGKPAIEVGKWYFGKIIAYHNGFVWTSDNGIRKLSVTKFRPIRTEREKVIETASLIMMKNSGSYGQGAEALYNAGMLVLPPKKGDTKY